MPYIIVIVFKIVSTWGGTLSVHIGHNIHLRVVARAQKPWRRRDIWTLLAVRPKFANNASIELRLVTLHRPIRRDLMARMFGADTQWPHDSAGGVNTQTTAAYYRSASAKTPNTRSTTIAILSQRRSSVNTPPSEASGRGRSNNSRCLLQTRAQLSELMSSSSTGNPRIICRESSFTPESCAFRRRYSHDNTA